MTRTISRSEVQAGLDDGTLTLVDALPASCYDQRHLPSAVNLIAEDVASQAEKVLPDKNAAIVTYCSNPACNNSSQVAALLEQHGYTDARKYAGGIEDWVAAGLPTEP